MKISIFAATFFVVALVCMPHLGCMENGLYLFDIVQFLAPLDPDNGAHTQKQYRTILNHLHKNEITVDQFIKGMVNVQMQKAIMLCDCHDDESRKMADKTVLEMRTDLEAAYYYELIKRSKYYTQEPPVTPRYLITDRFQIAVEWGVSFARILIDRTVDKAEMIELMRQKQQEVEGKDSALFLSFGKIIILLKKVGGLQEAEGLDSVERDLKACTMCEERQ